MTFYLKTIGALLLFVTVLIVSLTDLLFHRSLKTNPTAQSVSKGTEPLSDHHHQPWKSPATNILYPGELPGYTGWARPANTLAGSFAIVQYDSHAKMNRPWRIQLHCSDKACAQGGSLFYVRAYGPAVLTGMIDDHHNGTFDVYFYPFDAGSYTVEVVLSFSSHPNWNDLPVEREKAAHFEGYMLPGFPLKMDVSANSHIASTKYSELPRCNMSQLTEVVEEGPLTTGRWVVTGRNVEQAYVPQNQTLRANLKDYQTAHTSTGVTMDYRPVECSILSEKEAMDSTTLTSCIRQDQKQSATAPRQMQPYVIFIGDSNFRAQQEIFQERFFGRKLPSMRISTEGGVMAKLKDIISELDRLAVDADVRDYFVIFNSGLHDLDKMCEFSRIEYRQNLGIRSDAGFSCLQQYSESVTELVRAVAAFPARLRVWQTSPAGWPKWGNFGVAWPADRYQKFPLDPTSVAVWNSAAGNVLEPFRQNKSIFVQDAYWLTLARPDHRESDLENSLSKHLVHAGPNVYDVLLRKWAMMILEAICPRSR